MLDKNPNVSIDLSGVGGKRLDLPVPTKSESPIDLSDLYGEHGGLVAPPSDVKPEQPKDDTE